MRYISPSSLKALTSDKFMRFCCRRIDGGCDGNITFEHVIIFMGRQLDKPWSIIPLCTKHHSVGIWQNNGLLVKEINESIALNRASLEEIEEISKIENYLKKRNFLNEKYKNRYLLKNL